MTVTFDQLEYFLALARHGRFTRAAEASYVSQSTLSKQIKALETELGVTLFDRTPDGTSLTAAGEAFYGFASRTFKEFRRAREELQRFRGHGRLSVRVGVLPLAGPYRLTDDLVDFQVENLNVQIDLLERNQVSLARRMELHRLDVAIMRTDRLDPGEFTFFPMVRDEMVVVCEKSHPLGRQSQVTVDELRDARFVLLGPESMLHTIWLDVCRRHGFLPHVVNTMARHEAVLAAVTRDIGITVLPYGITQERYASQLVCVPLDEVVTTDVGLVVARQRELTPWAQLLVDFFTDRYPEPRRIEPLRPR